MWPQAEHAPVFAGSRAGMAGFCFILSVTIANWLDAFGSARSMADPK